MKSRMLITLALTLTIVIGFIQAQEQVSPFLMNEWYDVFIQGQKAGYSHSTVEQTKYNDKDCYKYTEEMSFKIQRGANDFFESKSESIKYINLDFSPIYQIETKYDGGQKTVTEVTVSGGEIIFTKTLNDEKSKMRNVKAPKSVIFTMDGFMLKKKGLLKTGAEASFNALFNETSQIVTETVKVIKEEKITIGDTEHDSFLAEGTNSAMPGIILKLNMSPDGSGLKVSASIMEMIKSTELKAKATQQAAVFSIYVNTNARIPAINNISEMALKVTFKEQYENAIPVNEYQTVVQDKNQNIVTLTAIPLDMKITPKIPVKDEAVKKYLNPSIKVQSDDAKIIAQVKEIVKNEKDAAAITQALTGWIFKNIKKKSSVAAANSARETLTEKMGDCTEHSALLCAFARASGIPARQVCGLVFDGSRFGYHAWDEIYLGKWIPADATINRVGIPAGYIKLGEMEEGEEAMAQSYTGMLKLFGNISIEVTSAKDNAGKPIDLAPKGK